MRRFFVAGVLALGLIAASQQAHAANVRLFVHHKVTDYKAWRVGYDSFNATRTKMGVVAQAVYCTVDDSNDVTVTHDFKTAAKAKAFMGSKELKDAMAKAGVVGAPEVWLTMAAGK